MGAKPRPEPRPSRRVGEDPGAGGLHARAFTCSRSHLGGAHSAVLASRPSRGESPGSPAKERTGRGATSGARREPPPDLWLDLTCTRDSGKRPQRPPSSPRMQPRAGPLRTCRITSPGARLSSSSSCARYPARTSASAGGGWRGHAV